jgi:hypothetical protein
MDNFWQYVNSHLSRALAEEIVKDYIQDEHGTLKLVNVSAQGASEAGYTKKEWVKEYGLFPILATGQSIGDCWMLACTPESVAPERNLPSFIRVVRDLTVDDIGPVV